MITKTNLDCFRGDTKSWALTVTKDNTTVSLTGAKLWMTARRGGPGGAIVFQRTSPSTGIVIDPDQSANRGKAVVTLASESTSSLAAEEVILYYDIQVKTATGELWTVSYGDLTVTPDSTTETA